MVLKSSGKLAVIWKNPDSFEIIRKIGYHLENPYSFEIIRKIGSHLEKSGQFWNNPENWQSSGKSRQFWNHLENWQSSGKSGQFWNHPENWQSSGKKSGQFWNHPENWKSSGKIRIVLKVLRQFKRFFRLYAQKLSGRAKTFRVAMLPCYPGFWASDVISQWLDRNINATMTFQSRPISYLRVWCVTSFSHPHPFWLSWIF